MWSVTDTLMSITQFSCKPTDFKLTFATVHQLTHDKSGLNGLADADVIGNQQAHRAQALGITQK